MAASHLYLLIQFKKTIVMGRAGKSGNYQLEKIQVSLAVSGL